MANEDWRKCVTWLSRVKLISADHFLNTPEAKLTDFCKFLRDGVVICSILHSLDENSIDMKTVNKRPQNAQFLCMKNIGIFLSCVEKFDLRVEDLFEPQMLFEFTDFGRVVQTLSKLSRCPKAQQSGVVGFPEDNGRVYDQEIYHSLEDMVNCSTSSNGHQGSIRDEDPYSFEEENIYEELIPSKEIPLRPKGALEKKDYCLLELVDTEKNYVDALTIIHDGFYLPLFDILGEERSQKIFFKIEDLCNIHKCLYQHLIQARPPSLNVGHCVSTAFLDNQEKLLVYGEYCANLTEVQLLLDEIMLKDPAIREKILDCQQRVKDGKHQLREYLVVPLQRILKYHLLLKELVKNSVDSHEDYHQLEQATEAMLDLSEYINEVKRDREMLQIIQDLQGSITDIPDELSNLQDLGRLRHDGEIKIESHPDKNKNRYVFVFDKVMVMCKQQTKEERYVYKDHVWLEHCEVQDVSAVTVGKKKDSFILVFEGKRKAYTIITKNSDAKNMWRNILTDAIGYLKPTANTLSGHSFTVTTFEKTNSRCCICSKLMKGCFYQGYQCTVCKQICHKGCLIRASRCPGNCPPIALMPRPLSITERNPLPEYWNLQVREHPWWVEKMSRDEATSQLLSTTEGTFLLRWSDKNMQPALSMRAMGEVKHMRIYRQENTGYFFLSEARYFRSIVELINYYHQNLLSECFQGLDYKLKRPVYDTATARFAYDARGANHLSLRKDERVVIISREGEGRGWWKGRIGTRAGYFPKEYVIVDLDPMDGW